ncbi:MAG: hypothetical protein UV92_C0031G0014 [Parcubacteria group bacterium GW2011_GWA1_43_27]|nr:MAG: hypothetical protein UV92_C0031G0014 [Parcubacteria group bacterium GW2011_GWA1_43_27]
MSLDVYIYNSVISLTAGSAIWQLLSVLAASGLIWFLVIWYIFSVLGRKKTGPVEFFALILGGSMVYLFNIGVSIWWWRPRPFVLVVGLSGSVIGSFGAGSGWGSLSS